MAIVWLVLCQILFGRLRANDPDVFESIGEPHVITNNKIRHGGPFFRLLYSSRYTLTDPTSQKLVAVMRWYLALYLVGFISLLAPFLWAFGTAA